MARASVATAAMLVIVVLSTGARAETCACCGCGNHPQLVPEADPAAEEVGSERPLQALLAAGTAVTVTSYVLAVIIAHGEPHPNLAIDTIPVAGPIASAVRNGADQGNASFLSFLGAAQGMGLLIIASALTDLVLERRALLDLNATANGCSARLTFRLP